MACYGFIFSTAFSSSTIRSRNILPLMVSTMGIRGTASAASALIFIREIRCFKFLTRRSSSHLVIQFIGAIPRKIDAAAVDQE